MDGVSVEEVFTFYNTSRYSSLTVYAICVGYYLLSITWYSHLLWLPLMF